MSFVFTFLIFPKKISTFKGGAYKNIFHKQILLSKREAQVFPLEPSVLTTSGHRLSNHTCQGSGQFSSKICFAS